MAKYYYIRRFRDLGKKLTQEAGKTPDGIPWLSDLQPGLMASANKRLP
jgi:hypothetical protein